MQPLAMAAGSLSKTLLQVDLIRYPYLEEDISKCTDDR